MFRGGAASAREEWAKPFYSCAAKRFRRTYTSKPARRLLLAGENVQRFETLGRLFPPQLIFRSKIVWVNFGGLLATSLQPCGKKIAR